MDIKEEILRIKKQNDVCVLAHSYQTDDILDVADIVGDSFELSRKAAKLTNKNLVMCGVRFMAETAKILSPDKRVFLANGNAGCPMADSMTLEELRELKKKYPKYAVACYINTTSKLKTECDVCVTSSSALKILENYPAEGILFVPDRNLGSYIKNKIPGKNIIPANGCCPIHASVTGKETMEMKAKYPGVKLLAHPECSPEVVESADFVGSTSGIMKFARESGDNTFIIGTENEIACHLEREMPNKKFIRLSPKLVCRDMKLTKIEDVLKAVQLNSEEIILDNDVYVGAKRCIDEMIRLG